MFCFIFFNTFSTDLELSKHIKKHLSTKRYNHFSKFRVCYFLKNKLFFKDFKLFKLHHMKWRFYDRILFFNFLNVNIKKRFYSFGLQCSSFLKNSYSIFLKQKLFKSLFLKKQLLLNRLDIVLWQSGFCFSLKFIRQLIFHGFFAVNGKCIKSCNYYLSKGDVVSIFDKFDFYERRPRVKTNFHPFTKVRFFTYFNKVMSHCYKKQNNIDLKFGKLEDNFLRFYDLFCFKFFSYFSLSFAFFYNLFYGFILKLVISHFLFLKKYSFKVLKKLLNILFKLFLNKYFVVFSYTHITKYKNQSNYSFLFVNSSSFLKLFAIYPKHLQFKLKKFNKLIKKVKFSKIKKSKKLLKLVNLNHFRKNYIYTFDFLNNNLFLTSFFQCLKNIEVFWEKFYQFSFYFCSKRKLTMFMIYGASLLGRTLILKDKVLITQNVKDIRTQSLPFLYHSQEIHYSFVRKISSIFYSYQNFFCYWIVFYSFLKKFYFLKNYYELSFEFPSKFINQTHNLNILTQKDDFKELFDSSSFLKSFYSFSLYFKKYNNIEIDLSSFRFIFLDLSSNFLKNTMLMQNLIIVFLLRFYKY